MEIELTTQEARVLGSLIEKSTTTPDYYPLSLGALVSACNQKSSRDPVMQLDETTVLAALDGLMRKRLAIEKSPAGSRVTKYAHRLSNTLGLTYDFSAEELALICLLLLRGAQTPGELRARSGRLFSFASLEHIERTLVGLMEREDGPYVARLPREPGRKEARYAHLLCGEVEVLIEDTPPPAASVGSPTEERLASLEFEVARLRSELDALKTSLGE